MTNKDKTIKRIEFQQEQNEKDQKEYGRVSLFNRLELEYLEGVLKDLEVLEILKRIVKIVDYSKQPATSLDDQLFILSGGEIKNVEDYNKIKEWLDNE